MGLVILMNKHLGDLPANAQPIMTQALLAEGRGGAGHTYEVVDTSAVVGKVYTYWLLETETTGQKLSYGPAYYEGGKTRLFLPMLRMVR